MPDATLSFTATGLSLTWRLSPLVADLLGRTVSVHWLRSPVFAARHRTSFPTRPRPPRLAASCPMASTAAILTGILTIGVPTILAITLHEAAHGFVALAFGDPTAKEQGRLSLNPIRHIDPFGTIILPAVLWFSVHTVFGWAKPVPVN